MSTQWSQLVQDVMLQVRDLLKDGYSVFQNVLADTLLCKDSVCALHMPLFKDGGNDIYTFRIYDNGETCDVCIARNVVDPATGEKTSCRKTKRYLKLSDGLYELNAIYDS